MFIFLLMLSLKIVESVFILASKLTPFTIKESFTNILPFTSKLESILAPRDTVKESLKLSPDATVNFPPTYKFCPTVKFESINVLPFTLKESLMVNKESNLALPFTYNESFKEVTLFTVNVESNCTLPKA